MGKRSAKGMPVNVKFVSKIDIDTYRQKINTEISTLTKTKNIYLLSNSLTVLSKYMLGSFCVSFNANNTKPNCIVS